jgi:hypothetical protein
MLVDNLTDAIKQDIILPTFFQLSQEVLRASFDWNN